MTVPYQSCCLIISVLLSDSTSASIRYDMLYFFLLACCLFLFFFFQAEDGIRDDLVTGVQTCALPISYANAGHPHAFRRDQESMRVPGVGIGQRALRRIGDRVTEREEHLGLLELLRQRHLEPPERLVRSEERRVGKEGRSGSVR